MARRLPELTVLCTTYLEGQDMFDRIVAGIDDREGGRDALALAATLSRSTGAELIAVRVYPYETHPTRASVRGFEEELRADATAELERLLAESGVAARVMVVGDSSPARGLHHVAEHEDAGLLVVGSTHRGHVGRVLVGGVSASVLHHAPCPVAVAPCGFAERDAELTTIGVGFDGSKESQAALGLAAEVAKVAGARLQILSVVATAVPAAYPAAYERDWVTQAEESGRDEVERAHRTVEEVGVEASGEMAIGSPVEALVELSSSVDLLVVGSRGFGPVRRLLLGSTSDRLVREAACPVIAVPRPASAA
jgi:nucleotide-binding universal stress UspA family protein